ncbi:hypothetical protein [Micropruina sp.]|uniref:hypothetical protein n=1 Tax=Micropruina sp. TaxID=2737536 RepID=UPI0039E51CDF
MTETKTAEKTELTKNAEATEDKPKLFNLTQIAGGALAAITTAALGSRLGYAGTLAGAGIASVLAAFASTLYTKGLERTREGVKKIVLRDADGRTEVVTVPDDAVDDNDGKRSAASVGGRRRGSRRPWMVFGGMLATAAVTFVVAMGIVTGWEFGTGQTLDGRTGTTIGQVSNKKAAPKPSASATSTKPTQSATATATPTATPTPTATETPTATATPTATPTATEEASKAPADAGAAAVAD